MHMRKVILSSVTLVVLMAVITNGAEASQPVLEKQAKITEAQARSTALAMGRKWDSKELRTGKRERQTNMVFRYRHSQNAEYHRSSGRRQNR